MHDEWWTSLDGFNQKDKGFFKKHCLNLQIIYNKEK